ncbi:ABC transporter ATP-binding protein [Metarhizobium album]|uniref:ABC transporter ATP-binding protein n=1 Tax=Metarhizobium album TaxID=2182425 RepID=A0A2U2DJ84_9HYPH|nr:ABC transporter ATP-binding protein [Rhizobium album]PWE53365.1 ABC transporter ATP-binding protein [Rhizobium album]
MLKVSGMSVRYDSVIVALNGIDFEAAEGRVVALLGPNGAGKSTLLKAVAGMLPFEQGDISDGRVAFNGASLSGKPPAAITRSGIALVQDGRQCFRNLTVGENLRAASFRHPNGSSARLDLVLSYFPILEEFLDRQAGLLSGGQLQMLVIGMALMLQPRLLMLDEPSLGLSPVMVQSVFEIVERLHRDLGMTVIVAEQTVPRLMQIADDVYVLSRGRVALHAPPGDINEERLQRLYLS